MHLSVVGLPRFRATQDTNEIFDQIGSLENFKHKCEVSSVFCLKKLPPGVPHLTHESDSN